MKIQIFGYLKMKHLISDEDMEIITYNIENINNSNKIKQNNNIKLQNINVKVLILFYNLWSYRNLCVWPYTQYDDGGYG